jgi:hypothetical protein
MLAKVHTNGRPTDFYHAPLVSTQMTKMGRNSDLTHVSPKIDNRGRDPDSVTVSDKNVSQVIVKKKPANGRDPDLTHIVPKVDSRGRDLRRRLPGPTSLTGHSPAAVRLGGPLSRAGLPRHPVQTNRFGARDANRQDCNGSVCDNALNCMGSVEKLLPPDPVTAVRHSEIFEFVRPHEEIQPELDKSSQKTDTVRKERETNNNN